MKEFILQLKKNASNTFKLNVFSQCNKNKKKTVEISPTLENINPNRIMEQMTLLIVLITFGSLVSQVQSLGVFLWGFNYIFFIILRKMIDHRLAEIEVVTIHKRAMVLAKY